MAVAIRQTASALSGGGNLSVTLGSAPLAGSVLFALYLHRDDPNNGMPGQTLGPTMTALGTGMFKSRTDFGDIGRLLYRVVVAGDSAGPYRWGIDDNDAVVLAELTGLDGAAGPGAFVEASHQNSTTVALARNPGPGLVAVAGFVTRLNGNGGTFTPNGASTQIGQVQPIQHGRGALVYGLTNVTLGGTQSGGTQDDQYFWGGLAVQWNLPVVAAGRTFADVLG